MGGGVESGWDWESASAPLSLLKRWPARGTSRPGRRILVSSISGCNSFQTTVARNFVLPEQVLTMHLLKREWNLVQF